MKTYIVSGAGSGIGRAIAQVLAQASPENCVILLGRNADKLRATQSLLERAAQHIVAPVDMTDKNALHKAFAEIQLPSRNLVGVVANAGLGSGNQYGSGDQWLDIIKTNLTGTYYFIQEALPALKASSAAFKHIVIMSSALARIGLPQFSAYSASKAGLFGLTRSMAVEFAPERILVNAICPGWVSTELTNAGIKAMAEQAHKTVEQFKKEMMERVPLHRMSEPEEIANFVQFLLSNQQTSITGQILDINNGTWM